MKIVPQKILEDLGLNKILVDLLEDLQFERQRLTVVESDPANVTEEPCILYNRTTGKLWVCDTDSWREVDSDIDLSAYITEEEVDGKLEGKAALDHNHDSNYALASHYHDGRYYTETETDALLALKSGTSHTHTSFASLYIGSASNKTAFDTAGHQTMEGTARPWRDELGELIGKVFKGARISENTDEGTLDFADNCVSADDFVITNVQLNHDKDLAAALYPHLHWMQASANIPNWLLQYRWQVNGAAKVTTWTPLKMNTTVHAYSAAMHQICYCAPVAVPAGSDLSDIVQFRISRDTANVSTLFDGLDPLTGAASAMSFDVHFQINSLGSDDEYSK